MPLRMPGPLGAISYKDRPMFDDKVMMHPDYAYNGSKGGSTWKSKVERYIITKAPCLREVLEWAESEDNEEIDESKFTRAVATRLTEEQALSVSSQIWGFLSGCLTGAAEVMFRRAEWLNGIDAWRRVVRQIDHGRAIRLETLRREVKEIHTKPIRSLEAVEEGVASFENTMQEFVKAGGPEPPESELKSDLLRILPKELRELFIWHSTDVNVSFQRFRDTIVHQTAQVLLNRGGRVLNAVDRQQDHDDELTEEQIIAKLTIAEPDERDQLLEELMAIRSGRPGGQRGRTRERARPPRRATPAGGERGPRRCPNCCETHASLKCPHPPVDREKRPCWNCKQVGHTSANCPKAKAPRPPGSIRTVEAENEPRLTMAVTEGDFVPPEAPSAP